MNKANIILRAEQSRAEQSRAEQSRAEQNNCALLFILEPPLPGYFPCKEGFL